MSRASKGKVRTFADSVTRFFTKDFGLKALSLALAVVVYGVLNPETESPAALPLIKIEQNDGEAVGRVAPNAPEPAPATRQDASSPYPAPADSSPRRPDVAVVGRVAPNAPKPDDGGLGANRPTNDSSLPDGALRATRPTSNEKN